MPQNYFRSLGNSKARNQDPWKFHIIFSWSPLEIPLCSYLTPRSRNSTCYFFDTLGNSMSLSPAAPLLCVFFLEQPNTIVNQLIAFKALKKGQFFFFCFDAPSKHFSGLPVTSRLQAAIKITLHLAFLKLKDI